MTDKKITEASDHKIGQLVLVKNHCKGPFNPTYIYDHQVAEILNDSTVLLTTLDGKEKKFNIHNVKLVSTLGVYVGSQVEVPTGAFSQFKDSILQTSRNEGSKAFHSIHTTYNRKQSINKYKSILTYDYTSGKKFNNY